MISRRRLLCDAVEHLAAEPRAQQAYLAGIGLPDRVDELALEFDDIAAARDDMLATGELTPDEYREIGQIDTLLAQIGGEANAHLWTPLGLTSSAEWTEIRQQAQSCLRLMGQTQLDR